MPGRRIAVRLQLIAAASLVVVAVAWPAARAQSTDMVHCVDGATVKPGPTACNGHGGVRGAVQVNSAPAQGSVTVNSAPVGGKSHSTPTVVHCNDGTTEQAPPSGAAVTGPLCQHHGGVNERPTTVGAPPPHPTGAVTVSTPPVGAKHHASPDVVHCNDGTTEARTPPGIMRLSPYCDHHRGVKEQPTSVGAQPSATGSVKVTSPPSSGGGQPGVSTKTSANSVLCKDGTWQPKTALQPCANHGGVKETPVKVGTPER